MREKNEENANGLSMGYYMQGKWIMVCPCSQFGDIIFIKKKIEKRRDKTDMMMMMMRSITMSWSFLYKLYLFVFNEHKTLLPICIMVFGCAGTITRNSGFKIH